MPPKKKSFEQWKEEIAMFLVSNKEGCTLQFLNDFFSDQDDPIPYKDFGYETIKEFLYAMRDIFQIRQFYNGRYYFFLSDEFQIPQDCKSLRRTVLQQRVSDKYGARPLLSNTTKVSPDVLIPRPYVDNYVSPPTFYRQESHLMGNVNSQPRPLMPLNFPGLITPMMLPFRTNYLPISDAYSSQPVPPMFLPAARQLPNNPPLLQNPPKPLTSSYFHQSHEEYLARVTMQYRKPTIVSAVGSTPIVPQKNIVADVSVNCENTDISVQRHMERLTISEDIKVVSKSPHKLEEIKVQIKVEEPKELKKFEEPEKPEKMDEPKELKVEKSEELTKISRLRQILSRKQENLDPQKEAKKILLVGSILKLPDKPAYRKPIDSFEIYTPYNAADFVLKGRAEDDEPVIRISRNPSSSIIDVSDIPKRGRVVKRIEESEKMVRISRSSRTYTNDYDYDFELD